MKNKVKDVISLNINIKKYILRVFVIFLIAVSVPLMVSIGYVLVNQAENEVSFREELYESQVEFGVSNVDNFISKCIEFSNLIASHGTYLREIQNNDYKKAVYTYKSMYDLLIAFKNNNSDEINVSMYIKSSDKVLSTSNAIDDLADYANADLIEEFMLVEQSVFFKQLDNQLVFISAIPNFYYDDNLVFLFYIDIANLSLASSQQTFLVVEDDEVLFNSDEVYLDLLVLDDESTTYIYETDNSAICYTLSSYGIIFGNVFDTSNLGKENRTFVLVSISIVLICLLVASLFAYVATFVYSKPIIKLSSTMKSLPDQIKVNSDKPIFDYVSETLMFLEEQNKAYSNTISKNREIVKDQAVRHLIYNHRIKSDYDLQTYLQDYGFSFNSNIAVLVVLAVNVDFANDKFNKLSEMNVLIQQLAHEVFEEKNVFIGSSILENRFISILIDADKIEEKNYLIEDIIQDTLNVIKLQIDIPINTAFSYTLENIVDVNESFVLMKKQLEKSKAQNRTFLIKQDKDDSYCFPASINTSLINAIRSNEIKIVKEILDKMYEMELISEHPNKDQYFFAILCKVFSDFYDSWTDFSVKAQELKNLFKEYDNVEERYRQIYIIFEKIICTANVDDSETENDDYIIAAKQYMHDNIKEDFSISLIADELNISISYFNRIFKQRTGITPLQYMTNIRLKRAKDLLSNTQMTIKDIAAEVGYKEIRSFVRYFKKIEGITPTEYKSLNK